MRYHELLLEYNKQDLINRYDTKVNDKLNTFDKRSKLKSLDQLLGFLEGKLRETNELQIIDPYMKWIIHQYANYKNPEGHITGIRFVEDILSRVVPILLKYDSLKKKKKLNPDEMDIGRIKSLQQLDNIVDRFGEQESNSEARSKEEKQFYNTNQATLLLNNSDYKIVVPHTKLAAQFFGRNTKWCTSAQRSNKFSYYNKKGPLYIVLYKPNNQRWQFHFQEAQYMDEKDEEINLDEFKKNHPNIIKFFLKMDLDDPIFTLRMIDDVSKIPNSYKITYLKKSKYSMKFFDSSTEAMQLYVIQGDPHNLSFIKNPTNKVIMTAMIGDAWVIEYIPNPSEKLQKMAIDQDIEILDVIENPTERIQMLAIKKDPEAYNHIRNKSPNVVQYYNRHFNKNKIN